MEAVIIIESIIIILSLFGYIRQVFRLKKDNKIGTFSIYVPGVIILASILKIFFWFIKPFSFSLLLQAFLLILIHLVLLKLCVSLREQKIDYHKNYIRNFWKWQHYHQYILFLIGFCSILSLVTYIAVSYEAPVIGDILAYISTIIEIYLAIPQILSSYKSRSVEGVSKIMILVWIINDSLKTGYFIFYSQPIQFVLTGASQVLLDLVLIAEMIIFRQKRLEKISSEEKKQ